MHDNTTVNPDASLFTSRAHAHSMLRCLTLHQFHDPRTISLICSSFVRGSPSPSLPLVVSPYHPDSVIQHCCPSAIQHCHPASVIQHSVVLLLSFSFISPCFSPCSSALSSFFLSPHSSHLSHDVFLSLLLPFHSPLSGRMSMTCSTPLLTWRSTPHTSLCVRSPWTSRQWRRRRTMGSTGGWNSSGWVLAYCTWLSYLYCCIWLTPHATVSTLVQFCYCLLFCLVCHFVAPASPLSAGGFPMRFLLWYLHAYLPVDRSPLLCCLSTHSNDSVLRF